MPTVLVVEYDHESRVMMRRVLEEGGYSVISRTDLRSALDTLKESPGIQLVLIDQDLSGFEDFLNEKGRSPALATIPLISFVQPLDPGQLLERINGSRRQFNRS